MTREACPPGFRAAVFRRAGHRCERCGTHTSLTLSHCIARSRGGPWTHWNVRALCGSGTTGCHGWLEANPAQAEAEGWRIPGSIVRGRYVGPNASVRYLVNEGVWPLEAEVEEVYVPQLDAATWRPRSWD